MSHLDLLHFYKNKKVLVTGGASFIGSHLVELLLSAGARVSVADDLSSGKMENLQGSIQNIQFHEVDLRHSERAQEVMRHQEMVFHLAAFHGGRGFIDTHPVGCCGNMALDNVVFTAAADQGVQKIVFASSACVYPTHLQSDESSRLLLKESDANFDEPGKAFADGEYGWAKLMGELQLRAVHKERQVDAVACRIFTAYGERENETHAVIALIAKALKKMDPFPIWGNGLQTRNFTYVKDTVMGLALAGAVNRGGPQFSTLNIGSSEHHSILNLLEEIFKVLHWRPESIVRELDKPIGVRSRASDNSRIQALTQWQPQVSLTEGVTRTAYWYSQHRPIEGLESLSNFLMERS